MDFFAPISHGRRERGSMVEFWRTKIFIKQGDITEESVDVIVNAANSGLMGGGGVDGAIHRAGGPAIIAECKKIREDQGRCPTGEAVITTAGDLDAQYVVHTVGPVWHGGNKGEEKLLRNAYTNSLAVATEKGAKTIAFPAISTGVYGYPIDQAAAVAMKAVQAYCASHNQYTEVRFILFSEGDYTIYEKALQEIS